MMARVFRYEAQIGNISLMVGILISAGVKTETSYVQPFSVILTHKVKLPKLKSSAPSYKDWRCSRMGLIHVETIDDAISLINSGKYGNMACLFTSSGASHNFLE